MDPRAPGDVECVRLEVIGLLARAGEVDLGTVYRVLVEQLGSGVVTDVGMVIARLVRDHAIEILTRSLSPEGPQLGIARLAVAPGYPTFAV